jgi:hypothetical protein
VRFPNSDDELLWFKNPIGGIYTPNIGYKVLCDNEDLGAQAWWYKKIWKFKCLMKGKIFMWLVLSNKVPTRDNLQKRCRSRLGRCPLCKDDNES